MRTLFWIGLVNVLSILLTLSTTSYAQKAESTPPPEKKMNLNLTTLDELKTLPGISLEIAQAIFDNRPYQSFEDLLEVDGITEEFLLAIEENTEVKKLNINTTTIKELKKLPGITPEMAEAIIEGRSYEIVEELLKIKGIGEEELAKFEGFIEAKPREGEDGADKGWKPRKRNYPVPQSPRPPNKRIEEKEEKEEREEGE